MSEQQPAVQEKKKRPELSEEEKKKRAEEGKKRHEEKQKEHKEVACCEGDHVQPDKSGASEGHKKEKEKKKPAKAAGEAKELNPPPEFFQHRLRVWEEVKTSQQAQRAEVPIVVTLPDGKRVDATAFKTSPFDIAKSISQGLANACVAAKVNGDMWDLLRPLEKDSTLELVKFDSPEGKKVFWHSSAHVLGQALERRYGGKLCTGPAVDDGFYYDVFLDQTQVKSEDFADISALVQKVVSEKQPFERLALPKEKALEMFKYNPFKLEIIRSKVPDGAFCTAYRCGPLIDLCKGPHLPNTGYVKAFEVTKNSSSYWLGSADRESLQRVYGVSFPTKKELEEHLKFLEEAAARDHRNIGKQQELFFFHPLSPGCSFFLPHGARIYNKLMNLIRGEYLKRGFEEVVTPNVFNVDLWKTSGHWQNYQENMFAFDCDNTKFALKPMNCPGHCLMFQHRLRSYRELPIRFADFGVLHRNELSGALSGLTRVRRFQQDDAHIFCTHEQIFQEVKGALEFLECIYGIFGFEFSLELSTRPEKFLGEIAVWDKAEKQLADVLDACGKKWKLNPGDGAFYGPKIDIHIRDAINRSHQCATIQLDFQLPIRFKLEFQTEQGLATPVIIHRAILGSVERFMAILTEHIAGKWPFWISPRQCAICPVSEKFLDYAHQVQKALSLAGYYVDVKEADTSIQKKVRECQIAQYNYILVVGQKEVEDKTVNVRTRDNVVHGERTLDQLLAEWKELVENHK